RTVSFGLSSRTGFAPGSASARPMGVRGCDWERSLWQETHAVSVLPWAAANGEMAASVIARPTSGLRMCGRRRIIFRHFETQQSLAPGIFFAARLRVRLCQGEVDFKIVGLELRGLFQVFDSGLGISRFGERPAEHELGAGEGRIFGHRLTRVGQGFGPV